MLLTFHATAKDDDVTDASGRSSAREHARCRSAAPSSSFMRHAEFWIPVGITKRPAKFAARPKGPPAASKPCINRGTSPVSCIHTLDHLHQNKYNYNINNINNDNSINNNNTLDQDLGLSGGINSLRIGRRRRRLCNGIFGNGADRRRKSLRLVGYTAVAAGRTISRGSRGSPRGGTAAAQAGADAAQLQVEIQTLARHSASIQLR